MTLIKKQLKNQLKMKKTKEKVITVTCENLELHSSHRLYQKPINQKHLLKLLKSIIK